MEKTLCLRCQNIFDGPDRKRIRICPTCTKINKSIGSYFEPFKICYGNKKLSVAKE